MRREAGLVFRVSGFHGEPACTADLARKMIRLSGLVPDKDIEIRYTGLRPGEKLFEELTLKEENILPTCHEKIKIFQASPLDSTRLEVWLLELEALLETSPLFSPRGEAKCARGPSVRGARRLTTPT